MLSFASPIRLIEGHAIFADSENPKLFYVAPRMPAVSLDNNGKPLFALTQYMSLGTGDQAVWGGFLSLSTTLAVPAARMTQIRTKLRAEIDDSVRVAPLSFQSGDVRIVLLGQERKALGDDTPDPASTTAPPSIFDVEILGSGKPTLDGQGNASFQVGLNGKAAALLDQAMGQLAMPALVNYAMTIEGIRPAFHVKITADWSRVYKELQAKLNANVYYVRANLESTIKETFQNAHVKIETTVEAVDAAAEAKEAEKALLDWALNSFFNSSHTQDTTAPLIDSVVGGLGGLVDSLMPGVAVKLKNLREEEVKTFNAQLDRTMAERRVLTFDGTLGETLANFRVDADGNEKPEWQALKQTLVLRVDIPEDPRLNVKLSAVDRFAQDGLSAVIVDVARKNGDAWVDEKQFRFDSAGQNFDYSVALLSEGREALGAPYYYRVTAKFNPAASFGESENSVGDWVESRSKTLQIDPRADAGYVMTTVSIFSEPGFPFTQFEDITLELRVPVAKADGTEDYAQYQRLIFDRNKTLSTWAFRTLSGRLYDYRVTYRKPAGAGESIVTEWTRASTPLLTLTNPAAAARRLNIISNLPWDRLTFASLEIKYDDGENDIHINEQIVLNSTVPLIQRSYAIAKAEKQTMLYRLTAMFTNGRFLVGDWRETTDSALIVGAHMVEERHIRIFTKSTPIAKYNLKDIQLELEAVNDAGVTVYTQKMQLKGDATSFPSWDYPLGDPPVKKLRVKARFTTADGMSKSLEWQTTERDLLIVDPENRAVLVEQTG